MADVLLVSSALFLGFLHGLGADHLMAIVALSIPPPGQGTTRQRARAFGVALRFALGHALLLTVGAGVFIVAGWSLPVLVERGGEMLAGGLLVVLGGIGLWGLLAGRVYGHTHVHGHEPAPHWHLHIGRPDHHPLLRAHSHLPTIVGAAFAISSLRALAMLTPFGASLGSTPVWMLLSLIVVFAAGVLMSMSLFGVAFARIMSARAVARLGRAAGATMAIASIALGIYWLARA